MTANVKQRNQLLIGALIIVAIVAAGGAILLSGNQPVTVIDKYGDIPKTRLEDGGFVIGNPDARVTIVEFADFTCPHCQDYHETTEQFITQYVTTGQARFEYRMMPVTGSEYMEFSAKLAECADTLKPGSFWVARNLIFQMAALRRYDALGQELANQLGLPYGDLLQCTRTADQYATDGRLGQESGVQGTPAVMVRYDNGPLQWINLGGQVLNRGPVDLAVLSQVVRSSQ